jgi:hypothetical protein
VVKDQRVRIGIRGDPAFVVIQLQAGIGGTQVALTDGIHVFYDHQADRIPIVHIILVGALGRAVDVVLESIGQERPGKLIIPGIDRIEIIADESLRRLRPGSGCLCKGGRRAGIWISSQGLGDHGLDECVVRTRLGGRAGGIKNVAGG